MRLIVRGGATCFLSCNKRKKEDKRRGPQVEVEDTGVEAFYRDVSTYGRRDGTMSDGEATRSST